MYPGDKRGTRKNDQAKNCIVSMIIDPLFWQAAFFSFSTYLRGTQASYRDLIEIPKEKNDLPLTYKVEGDTIRHYLAVLKRFAPWRPKCYNIALTAIYLLDKKNIPYTLNMGFKKENNSLEGHAWVTVRNKIIVGKRSDLFKYNTLKP